MRIAIKRGLSLLVLLTFLVSVAGFADAKGASSFGGGGGRSASSGGFSTSRSVSTTKTPSTSGGMSFGGGASKGGGLGLFGTSKSEPVKTPNAPTQTQTGQSTTGGGFSTSGGQSAGAAKTGSIFGGQTIKEPPKTTAGYGQPIYTPPRYDSRQYHSYDPYTKRHTFRDRPYDYKPRWYRGDNDVVVINQNPSFLNLWFQLEMLETIHDMNQRDAMIKQMQTNPEYSKWRDEANKLSGENAALKAQLNSVDNPTDATKVAAAIAPTSGPVISETGSAAAPVKKSSGLGWFWWLVIIGSIAGLGYWFYRRNM